MSDDDRVRRALDLVTGIARSPVPSPRRTTGPAMATFSTVRPVAQAADPRRDHPWAFSEDVEAYGIAEKVVAGKRQTEVALKIYVEKKRPLRLLDAPVPPTLNLPGIGEIVTDVVEIGRVERQSLTQRVRPAMPGYSVGLASEATVAGTFGMVVRKTGQQSSLYLLSNAHAIAASGWATKGDTIIQPGGADGGTATDAIGQLSDWVPLVFDATGFPNLVDAAIAELDPDAATAAIARLGVPAGINTSLTRGTYVQKMGRTTTLSVARVEDVDLRLPSTYPQADGSLGRVGFSDQVLVTYYSAPGDSGSPVLDMDRKVVGLHVAGSPVIGIFCKIANVMAALDIEVVTGVAGA